MASEMMLGIFWPKAVYQRVEKKDPPESQCQWGWHLGQKYWGVVREQSDGFPIGAFKMTSTSGKLAQKTVEVENTTNSVRGMAQLSQYGLQPVSEQSRLNFATPFAVRLVDCSGRSRGQ